VPIGKGELFLGLFQTQLKQKYTVTLYTQDESFPLGAVVECEIQYIHSETKRQNIKIQQASL